MEEIALFVAYATGIISIVISLLMFVFKKRSTTLILKLSADAVALIYCLAIFFAKHEYQIFANVGTLVVAITRDIIYLLRKKYKIFDHPAWSIGFAASVVVSLVFTYKSPISLLPVIGSVISALTLFLMNQVQTKIGGIINCSFYVTYYALLLKGSDVLTLFQLIAYAVTIVGAVIGLIRMLCFKKETQQA